MFCCFNDTAPTDISTDGHTLSLHAARPILLAAIGTLVFPHQGGGLFGDGAHLGAAAAAHVENGPYMQGTDRGMGIPGAAGAMARSEEHTSELQSLMRISYAVFCLKKKKQQKHKRPTVATRKKETDER